MKNQFFFTRTLNDKVFIDSFNVNKIIRTVATEEGRIVVLDDLHERAENIPEFGSNGKPKGMKRVRNTFQSEINLNKEDSERFKRLTEALYL